MDHHETVRRDRGVPRDRRRMGINASCPNLIHHPARPRSLEPRASWIQTPGFSRRRRWSASSRRGRPTAWSATVSGSGRVRSGIRMALADTGRIVRQFRYGGLKLVVAGRVVGLAIAVAPVRVLGGSVVRVGVLDPLTFLAVPLVLGPAPLHSPICRPAAPAAPIRALGSGPPERARLGCLCSRSGHRPGRRPSRPPPARRSAHLTHKFERLSLHSPCARELP